MKNKLFSLEVIGFIFVSAFGTLSHFLFEFFNENTIIALFCPVNESVWEHLKLLFFPYLVWTGIEYFIIKRKADNYFSSKIKGVLIGMVFILAFFYSYTGITGTESTFIDILSFFIGTAISFIISYEFMRNGRNGTRLVEIISICIFAVAAGLFALFTFYPPLIPLFEDPETLTFGI